jgi:lipopolysaccharide/colanic/teichoic acid biosynthesis glycosyltransferase
VLPKLKGFRKICRLLAIPIDVSKAEILGRLIYKGFKIIDVVETDYDTIIITQPETIVNPSISNPVPDEGFLFTMKRLGENGKKITVFKFRSMHPYAEYVQEYLHKTNGLEIGGKFKNDFRVSTGGQILRRYWIDELPMLYNLLRGDIKLIGVRPISEHYFSLYPEQVRAIRRTCKPGLIPPFYADMPGTFEEIVQSEVNYLKAYENAPLHTDMKYLRRILTNIIVNKVRSK